MTNQERIKQIKERCEKATPGPWVAALSPNGSSVGSKKLDKTLFIPTSVGDPVADCIFVASSREDIPFLLERIEKLEKILKLLLVDLTNGKNLGKSWSEYQVCDASIKEAWEALGGMSDG